MVSLYLTLSPKDLAFLVKAFEGAGHLAIVKTLDGKKALCEIIFPQELATDVEKFLSLLPIAFERHRD